jgi:ABC-type transporter Mla subunit MlaD
MKIRRKYAPVYHDATLLLRPKTPLKDMTVEMDPGTPKAGAYKSGDTIPIAQTRPDVNFDEVLSALDGDTRSYLIVLLTAGGQAFSEPGAPADLRATFKRFEPTSRDLDQITTLLARRGRNVKHVVHDLRLLSEALGAKDTQLAQLVDSSNTTFHALADQDQNLRGALRELPPTLRQANVTLPKVTALADELGPTLQSLRPAARDLAPALRETRPFLRLTTPIIRNELRPFARDARPTIRDLNQIALRKGADNDLYDLVRTFPPLAQIALDTKNRTYDAGGGAKDVGRTRGAFPESTQALKDSAPIIAGGRPYTPDLFGWFDDFSNTGGYDALGGFSRVQTIFNAFDAASLVNPVPSLVPLDQRKELTAASIRTGQYKRCPGASEEPNPDGSNVFTPEQQKQLDCKEEDRATGAIK